MKIEMKTWIKMMLAGMLFFAGWSTSAQTFTEEDSEEDTATAAVTRQAGNQIFRAFGINNNANAARSANLRGNQVLLRQIGDFNELEVVTQTQASDITVVQQGDDNRTSLEYNTKTAFARLGQFGNGNTIRDYVFNPQEDVSLELTQQGNNIYFERFGANSMTRSLKLRQTEASPVIIIRGFN